MEKMTAILLVLLLLLLPSGCSGPQGDPTIEGLIYSLGEDSFLVVSGIDSADIPYDEWFASGEHKAISFTILPTTRIRMAGRFGSFQELTVGSRVRVWADNGVALSYPGQAGASRVEVLDDGE